MHLAQLLRHTIWKGMCFTTPVTNDSDSEHSSIVVEDV